MKRIYLDMKECSMEPGSITVAGDTFHYISRVLRMKEGDLFSGFDGTGREYEIEVSLMGKKSMTGRVISSRVTAERELPFSLAVYQSVPRGNKMDFIIGEMSQLGVSTVIPVESVRVSVSVPDGRYRAKTERWKRIAAAASSVSGRQMVTGIGQPVRFVKALEHEADLSIIFWEGSKVMLRDALRGADVRRNMSVRIFIGPEGGFSCEEVEMASARNVIPASLGPRILKVETAAVLGAAFTVYELENMLSGNPASDEGAGEREEDACHNDD